MADNISIPDTPFSEQIVTLERESYILELKYNNRFDFWSLNLYDSNRVPILLGEKCVASQEFLFISAKNLQLNGYLGIKSRTNTNVTRNNFGQERDHRLVFMSQEEVDRLNAVES